MSEDTLHLIGIGLALVYFVLMLSYDLKKRKEKK